MVIRYEEELIEIAQRDGYSSWRELLKDKYAELKSTRKTGKYFKRTHWFVSQHLKKMGVSLCNPGGANHVKWQGSGIMCAECGKKHATVKGVCNNCYCRAKQRKRKRDKLWKNIEEYEVAYDLP